jgi:hypothetical protein
LYSQSILMLCLKGKTGEACPRDYVVGENALLTELSRHM